MAVIREPGFEYSLMANLKFMFRYKVTVIKVIFTRQTRLPIDRSKYSDCHNWWRVIVWLSFNQAKANAR